MNVITDQPQHMTALARANKVRLARAEFHREIAGLAEHDGRERLAALFAGEDTPYELASAPVGDILQYLNRVGRRRAQQMLLAIGGRLGRHTPFRETRRFDALTRRERDVIADTLRWGR